MEYIDPQFCRTPTPVIPTESVNCAAINWRVEGPAFPGLSKPERLFRPAIFFVLAGKGVHGMSMHQVCESRFLLRRKSHARRLPLSARPSAIRIAIRIRVTQAFFQDRLSTAQLRDHGVDFFSIVRNPTVGPIVAIPICY
jgi:hypothetical protein